ncbi:hypothetical protein [Bradyrhizobium sp. AUGA SZCCT0182]|uniref:hypothetical protein n=1 Tax=Bradyrhizobium sp. AUGA SZCCT0182 TaxID=2807667 RepID=UPI0020126D30
MDLSFSKEEVAFRDEVRKFYKDHVPASTRQKLQEDRHLGKDEMVAKCLTLQSYQWSKSSREASALFQRDVGCFRG